MATTARQRAERATEQTFQRAEDTMGTFFDNGRQTFLSMLEYNRNTLRTGYEFARQFQEESFRLTDTWLDTVTKFQKSAIHSIQDWNNRVQDLAEQTAKETNDRIEETLDQGMELVTPGTRRTSRFR